MAKTKTSKKDAKPAKASKKDAKAAVIEKPKKEEGPKYTITDLAKKLNIEPASVRVKLRKHGIEKVGGRYGWATMAELDEIAKRLKTEPEEDDEEDEEEAEDDSEDEDEEEEEEDDE